jgi:hypothetical protein
MHFGYRAPQGIKKEVVIETIFRHKSVTGLVKRHRSTKLSQGTNSATGRYDYSADRHEFSRAVSETILREKFLCLI